MDYEKIVPNQKPGKATYKMITDYVKEKYDLVVKSTTIAEVKRSFGLEVGDYNIKDEKTNYRKEKITPDKRKAVEDALRHFGVIE
jgi:23S rRNA (uracil1939-C5)-methyltransferase